MIIRKKTLDKMIEDAVNQAIAEVNAYRDQKEEEQNYRNYLDKRFTDMSQEIANDLSYHEDRIRKLEERVEELSKRAY